MQVCGRSDIATSIRTRGFAADFVAPPSQTEPKRTNNKCNISNKNRKAKETKAKQRQAPKTRMQQRQKTASTMATKANLKNIPGRNEETTLKMPTPKILVDRP